MAILWENQSFLVLLVLEETELRFYIPLNTKQVISETFFPANLLA